MKPMHLPQPTAPCGAIDRHVDPMGWVRVGLHQRGLGYRGLGYRGLGYRGLGYRGLGYRKQGWMFAVIRRSTAP